MKLAALGSTLVHSGRIGYSSPLSGMAFSQLRMSALYSASVFCRRCFFESQRYSLTAYARPSTPRAKSRATKGLTVP